MTATAPAAPTSTGRKTHDFALLWVGAGMSFLATRMTALVYPLLVLWGGGSTATAGLVGFTALLPQFAVQLPAGAIVDRYDRRRLMLLSEIGCILAVGSLAIPVAGGRLWLPQLFAVAFIEGSLLVVHQLAERAAIPHVVAPDQLGSAFSRNEARTRGSSMLGQPLGTSLFALAHAFPLLFGAISHALSLLTLSLLRTPLNNERTAKPRPMRAEIGEGLAWLWRKPFIRALMFVLAGTNLLFQMVTFAVLPLFHDEHRSAALVGIVLACSSVGGLAGALTASHWMRRAGLRRILIICCVTWAAVTLLLPIGDNVPVMALLFAVSGYVGGVFNVPAVVYVVRVTPAELRGRVSSVAGLMSAGAMAFGWIAAGWLLSVITPRQTLTTVGLLFVLVLLATIISPSIRKASGPDEVRPLEEAPAP